MTTALSEYLAVNFLLVRETVMNMETYSVVLMVRVSSLAVLSWGEVFMINFTADIFAKDDV